MVTIVERGRAATIRALLCWLLLPTYGLTLHASPAPTTAMDRRVDEAISRGVAYILWRQRSDGSVVDDRQYSVTTTAWSILALAAAGNTPEDPTREGEAMRKAIDWLLGWPGAWNGNAYLASSQYNGMYEHAMATIALTQILAMGIDPTHERELRNRAASAINLIIGTQVTDGALGSWGNFPCSLGSALPNMPSTAWQLMALRSGRDVGIATPQRTLDRAIGNLRNDYTPQRIYRNLVSAQSSFSYSNTGFGRTYTVQLSSVRALQVCGLTEAPELKATLGTLPGTRPGRYYFYYSAFFFAQVLHAAGPEMAKEGRRTIEAILLPAQNADGSWLDGSDGLTADGPAHLSGNPNERAVGPVYCTTMAILSLLVPYERLPMFKY